MRWWLWPWAACTPAFGEFALEAGGGPMRHVGHLQTPAGGQPGTSSAGRPTFREAGLRGGAERWLAASKETSRWRVRIRYADAGEAGEARLQKALVSQGRRFGEGRSIRSAVSLDELSLQLTRRFDLPRGVRAELGARLAWTSFSLRIDGDDEHVNRAYHAHAVGVAGGVAKNFGGRWQVGAAFAAAPAFDGAAGGYHVEPRLRVRLGERWHVALGARLSAFRYDDSHKQDLPNRLRVRRRTLPTLAFEARF